MIGYFYVRHESKNKDIYLALSVISYSNFYHYYITNFRKDPTICPIEKLPFSSIDLDGAPRYFVDNAKKREIGKLPLKCPTKPCQWSGCVQDFIKV